MDENSGRWVGTNMALTWIVSIVALCLVFIVYASFIVAPSSDDKSDESASTDEVPDAELPVSVTPTVSKSKPDQEIIDDTEQVSESVIEDPDEEMVEGPVEEPVEEPEEEPEPVREIPVSVTGDYMTLKDVPAETLENLELITATLPELPRVAMQLLPMLTRPGVGAKEIATVISRDQTTAARLLRWVNSSFFGLESKVESLHRAVALLGLDTVRSAVMQGAFDQQINPVSIQGMAGTTIWRHASAVSIIAKDFARQVRGIEPDVAATAGLLHDIGFLLMLVMERRSLNIACEQARETFTPMVGCEDAYVGFNHQVMGECFVRAWRLPDVIADAIGKHHSPLKHGFEPLAGILWLADYVASRLDFACPDSQVLVAKDDEIDELLHLLGAKPQLDAMVTDALLKQIIQTTYFWSSDSKSQQAQSVNP